MTVSEKAQTLKALAEVRAKRIALERQAHNIEEGQGAGEKLEGLRVEFVGAG
jgi:predicted secreted protein